MILIFENRIYNPFSKSLWDLFIFKFLEQWFFSQENEDLIAPFSEQEIQDAIFGSGGDKSPGPDGSSFLFYQHFWELLKPYIINLFDAFHKEG